MRALKWRYNSQVAFENTVYPTALSEHSVAMEMRQMDQLRVGAVTTLDEPVLETIVRPTTQSRTRPV